MYDSVFQLEWIQFKTTHQLAILKRLFGLCCLIGVQKKPPEIGTSSKIISGTLCNVVVGGEQEERDFVQNTGNFGVTFVFDGSALRVVV